MKVRSGEWWRRYRWVTTAVVFLVTVGLIVFGCDRLRNWQPPANATKKMVDSVTVTGFARTGVLDMSGDRDHAFAQAYFIGPAPKPDPLVSVSVPEVQLKAVAPPPDPQPWEKGTPWGRGAPTTILMAKGERPDGCNVGVSYVTDPKQPGYQLTSEQADAVRAGTRVFLIVSVSNCGA